MTVVIAAKGAGFTLMSADSLTEVGGLKLVRMANSSKIIRFNNFAVGMSGNGPTRDVLEIMVYEPLPTGGEEEEEGSYDWNHHVIGNTIECFRFLEKFCEVFRDRADDETLQTVELLIATPTKVFSTIGDHTVFEVTDFWAVGSGSYFALGDMHRPYRPDMAQSELSSLMHSAIRTACFYSSGCQEPIDTELLTE